MKVVVLLHLVVVAAAMTAGVPHVRKQRQISYNTSRGAGGPSDFQVEPRRAVVRPGETITLLGNAGRPLRRCHFLLSDGRSVDLSRGPDSNPGPRVAATLEYFGRGLDSGECGLRVKRAREADDGLVECRVLPEGEGAHWWSSVSTLRVTNVSVSDLPVFDISPRHVAATRGGHVTITCDADRAIRLCVFHLPGQRVVDLSRGGDSPAAAGGARYAGAGLSRGHCGVTLTPVDPGLGGYVVCRVGTGDAWEEDVAKVTVTNNTNTPRYPDSTPPTQKEPSYKRQTTPSYDRDPQRGSSRPRVPLGEDDEGTPIPSSSGEGDLNCGRIKLQPAALITQGQGTEKGQWPWHVALYQNRGKDLTYICGGSVIGPKAVVTAAHCVTSRPSERVVNTEALVLYFGKYRRLAWSEDGVQHKQIDRVHVHPSFNGTTLQGDVAVVVLRSAVRFTDYVRPVCLWEPAKADLSQVIGKEGTVVGWGFDESGESPPELMMTRMPVVDQQTCIWSYREFFSQFTSNMTLCAGFRNGTSVCNGDSGGGLVFPTPRGGDNAPEWHLRALVSLSAPKGATRVCDPHHYVVFTDLAQYLSWLTPFVA